VECAGYGVVKQFVGHGIGRNLHEPPEVPNYGERGRGARLKKGMVIAIEPMVTAGSPDVRMLADGWTAVTADRSLAAHYEHSVAVTDGVPLILSRLH
jgi:methionyl aminopeptidase